MAYNQQLYYPNSYNPYTNYAQQMQNNQPMMQNQSGQQNQGLIWVSGEVGAKSYLMAPNSTVMLMDSETSRFFIKSTDSAGMPTIRTFEYKECSQSLPQSPQNEEKNLSEQFATKEEYRALSEKYEKLQALIADMQRTKPNKRKAEETENE